MKNVINHYVVFYSPGTFFSETSSVPIKSWDIKEALKFSKKIKERYGATPYGFIFESRKELKFDKKDTNEEWDIEGKIIKSSGTYFITGKVLTLEDIPDIEENRTLLSNMRYNKYNAVVQNTNSYKSTLPFKKTDVIINKRGKIIAWGENFNK